MAEPIVNPEIKFTKVRVTITNIITEMFCLRKYSKFRLISMSTFVLLNLVNVCFLYEMSVGLRFKLII